MSADYVPVIGLGLILLGAGMVTAAVLRWRREDKAREQEHV